MIRRPTTTAFTAASIAAAAALLATPSVAGERPAYGLEPEGFDYPYEVQRFAFMSQGMEMSMAYMDVAAAGAPNGRTAVLLHGKNFCAATFERQIETLAAAGFRVVAPDQIGFCKSFKPQRYQFSFSSCRRTPTRC